MCWDDLFSSSSSYDFVWIFLLCNKSYKEYSLWLQFIGSRDVIKLIPVYCIRSIDLLDAYAIISGNKFIFKLNLQIALFTSKIMFYSHKLRYKKEKKCFSLKFQWKCYLSWKLFESIHCALLKKYEQQLQRRFYNPEVARWNDTKKRS